MKLLLPTPPGWSRQEVAATELLRSPDRSIDVLVLPLEGAKIEVPTWLWSVLVASQPNIEPTNITNGQLKTGFGWTALTVEADLGAESRFVAYFQFLDLGATVVASCTNRDATAWRDEVIGLLYFAAPDFSGDRSSCLGQLLGGPPPETRRPEAKLPADPWRRAFSGGDVVLVPRLEPDSGWIRRTADVTPLRTVEQLFSGFDTTPELGITHAGEYFAIASTRRDRALRIMAIVFGAESYTRIEANTIVRERFDMFMTTVRGLAVQEMLASGTGRLRPYYYEPPAGWHASARAGSTVWISPTCARQYHVLRVFEARPAEYDAAVRRRRFEAVAAEFLATPPTGPAIYYKDEHEVRVFMYTGMLGGSDLRILDATLTVGEYCYPLRVEFDARLLEASMQLIEDVVRTIIPLPSSVIEDHETAPEAFSHWSE